MGEGRLRSGVNLAKNTVSRNQVGPASIGENSEQKVKEP